MSAPVKAGILGIGAYLPEKRLTNAELERMVDTSDEWITKRTGIRERRIAAADESTSTLALKASKKALERAGVKPEELDLIIVATVTPDTLTPSTSCWLQAALGATGIASFDLSAACAGFLYGMEIAKLFVEGGVYRHILLVASDKLSAFVDWEDRSTCVLFGDGAGAAVIGPIRDGRGEILSVHMSADGRDAELIQIPAGGSRLPATPETVAQKQHFLKMQGTEVFKIAVTVMSEAVQGALKAAGLTIQNLDWLIPHQANLRIITAMAQKLGIPMEKVFLNIAKYGNTSAASVIIALDEAVETGQVREGQTVSLVAFGAGTTLAASILRW